MLRIWFAQSYCYRVCNALRFDLLLSEIEEFKTRVKTCMHSAKRATTSPKPKPSEELQKKNKAARATEEGKHNKHTHRAISKQKQGKKGRNKERVKTFPNSTVTLMPRLLSILDSSTSNSSPGWRLLTAGPLPLNLSVTETSCKQRRAA